MATAPVSMFTQIEDAIVAQILANVTVAREADNTPDDLIAKAPVGFAVRINKCDFKHIVMSKVKCFPSVQVLIAAKNLQGFKERRATIAPLVLGIVACLSERDLGLDIHDLCPESSRELQHDKLNDAGMILYELVFSTWFVAVLNQETAVALLSFANSYFLDPPVSHGEMTSPLPAPVEGPETVTVPECGS